MKENTGLACLGLVVLAVVGIVAGSIMDGWVLSTLWSWFIVPIFNLPALSIASAIGVSLVVALLTHQQDNSKSENSDTTELVVKLLVRITITPLLTLAMGWIVLQFI